MAEGRCFLQQDKETKKYYVMTGSAAREKVAQALRDDNTPKARATRRKKCHRQIRIFRSDDKLTMYLQSTLLFEHCFCIEFLKVFLYPVRTYCSLKEK